MRSAMMGILKGAGRLGLVLPIFAGPPGTLFDHGAIRDANTLETRVLRDWEISAEQPDIRRKLIEITVCEWWAGQKVRIPVTLCAPVGGGPCDRIIVANMPLADEPAMPSGLLLRLMRDQHAGVVLAGMDTIDALQPAGRLHLGMKAQLLATHDPRYTPAWFWGMSDMRALTAALAEPTVFQPGKVIATGRSKRGVAAAVCGIEDDRFTGIFPVVAPILQSPRGAFVRGTGEPTEDEANAAFLAQLPPGSNPLGLPDTARAALATREADHARQTISAAAAAAAGWSRAEMRALNEHAWDAGLMARHVEAARARGLEFLYHVGTNDSVTPGLLELGRLYPDFPVFILPGGQHGGPTAAGLTRRTPNEPEASHNLLAFARHHFGSVEPLPGAPRIGMVWSVARRELTVTARFPEGTAPESNRLWWALDRHPPTTLAAEFDPWESVPMAVAGEQMFRAVVAVPAGVSWVDFVTTHRHQVDGLPFHTSSSYQRFEPDAD